MGEHPEGASAGASAPAAGPFRSRRVNPRRCAGTSETLEPGAPALRFVRAPDGTLVLDLKEKLPGRGAWLSPSRGALLTALRRGGFSRAFKGPVTLGADLDPEGFADLVTEQLAEQALSRLGLLRRSGDLVVGHDNARAGAKKALAYLTPEDASAPETAKLAALLHKAARAPHLPLPVGRERLGRALGQDAVHLLLKQGTAARAALGKVILWRSFHG